MVKVKICSYWRLKNKEDIQGPLDIVVAQDILSAIDIYLSQDKRLKIEDITKVELIGSVLIRNDKI